MPEESAAQVSHQPSIELDNERLTINHADGTRTKISVQDLGAAEQLAFANLVVSQAIAERQGALADAVSQLGQALNGLAQSNAGRDPEVLIDSIISKITGVMGAAGVKLPGNGSAS